jgi:hypothetical protein
MTPFWGSRAERKAADRAPAKHQAASQDASDYQPLAMRQVRVSSPNTRSALSHPSQRGQGVKRLDRLHFKQPTP